MPVFRGVFRYYDVGGRPYYRHVAAQARAEREAPPERIGVFGAHCLFDFENHWRHRRGIGYIVYYSGYETGAPEDYHGGRRLRAAGGLQDCVGHHLDPAGRFERADYYEKPYEEEYGVPFQIPENLFGLFENQERGGAREGYRGALEPYRVVRLSTSSRKRGRLLRPPRRRSA